MKAIKVIITLAVIATAGYFFFQFCKKTEEAKPESDSASVVEKIKQVARLNAMEIEDETVFTDTMNNIGVVYWTRTRTIVSFNLDSLQYENRNDTLFVQMPKDTVAVYQLDEKILAAYYTNNAWLTPEITTKQSEEFHKRMKIKIQKQAETSEIRQKAYNTAQENLTKLLSAFKKPVVVI